MDTATLDRVKELCQKEADAQGLELISVRYYDDSLNGKTLEILIDKDYNITMEEIDAFTEKVSPLLDDVPGLDESYLLDISSGGSERKIPFSDLPKLVGHYIDVTLKDKTTQTMRLEKADAETADFLYFIKGRRKKVSLKAEDVETMKMGYKA